MNDSIGNIQQDTSMQMKEIYKLMAYMIAAGLYVQPPY